MKKKILIIDDFEPLLEEVVEFFNLEGYSVFSAKDGIEGIQMAIQHHPDIIVCDIEMPRMNGYEVFKNLEKIPTLSTVPFIFLTARIQADDFKKGLQMGVDDYITKPFNPEDLLLRINKRLEKIERLNEIHVSKLDIIFKNPIIGAFIYVDDKLVFVNERFTEITSYTKSDLNVLDIAKIILSESEQNISKLKGCLNKTYESIRLKLSLLTKQKKAVFIELFCKYLEYEGKNALIGTLISIDKNIDNTAFSGTNLDTSDSGFNDMIEYLASTGKDNIIEEILNTMDLIHFDKENKIQKLKNKINLSKRESEVLKFICLGYTNNEIAEKLFISNRTVDNHRANLLLKTGSKNTATLLAFAFKNKLVDIH